MWILSRRRHFFLGGQLQLPPMFTFIFNGHMPYIYEFYTIFQVAVESGVIIN